jgi:hypothetical protein
MKRIAEGLLWAALGGAATGVLELHDDLHKWSDYEVDYAHLGKVSSGGAIFGVAAFVQDLSRRRTLARLKQATASYRNAAAPACKPPS